MDETIANVIAFLFVIVWAALIGRRIWLKKTKSRSENEVQEDGRPLIEPAREKQKKYRPQNSNDLLNGWGRISSEDGTSSEDDTAFIVFTYEDAEAGLSAIGYAESERIAKTLQSKLKINPLLSSGLQMDIEPLISLHFPKRKLRPSVCPLNLLGLSFMAALRK